MAGRADQHETRQAALCSGLENEPLCCAVNLLGIADLDCSARKLCLSLPDDFCSEKEAA